MTVSQLGPADVPWVVETLAHRRRGLVPHAPVFWNPAPDAASAHTGYLEHLLSSGAAEAWRSGDAVLVAARTRTGLLVDDAYVPGEAWSTDGVALWNALAAAHAGEAVRFLCPVYEVERNEFARAAGLQVADTWWLRELDSGRADAEDVEVTLPGAVAGLVIAPPVYAPGGPMLYLPEVTDAAAALPAAVQRAPELGCAGIVVDRRAGQDELDAALREAGLRPHCNYFEGTIAPL